MAEKISIGKISDFPIGSVRAVDLDGIKIAVYNIEDRLFATDGECPHTGGPLGEGTLDGDKITCPLHGWVFNAKTGQCDFFENVKLETFPIIVGENREVFVELK